MEIAMLVLTAIGVAAAIIAALPPLGIDVRLFGRPNMPLEGIPYFRARQAWIAIAVALISLGISVAAFYYFFHPRVVEKIVEKPVEKIVEKPVSQPCPKPDSPPKPSKKTSDKKAQEEKPPIQQDCGGGNCAASVGQQGGITAGQINIGSPPLKLEYSVHMLQGDEKAAFNFDRQECPVVTHIRIIPNQSVPPPISVALDFDQPITKIGTTIEGAGGITGGGRFRVGLHAISSPIDSPGIGPHYPLIVEVCSATPVNLIGEPHLVN
jgi:hypothetical protein